MADVTAKFSLNNDNNLNPRFNLSEEDNIDATFVINASGTNWGNIGGEIQNQEDLYLILQDKASVESVESLTETVQNNYDTLDGKIDDTESALAGQITALSDTVDINNQNINNRVDTVEETISNLADVVSDNYTELDGKISDNTDAISTINDTISGYGNIVTHNVNEFATSVQGALADTALQPNDNISELVNDVGFITSASLPTDYVPNTRTINGYALSSNITLNYSDVGALSASTTINDLTTTAQQNALNSGATTTNIGQITINTNNISDIQDLIPNQATTSNQLADKNFVNSSIATNTAYFIGTFNSVAELEAYSGTLTNNDYAFVVGTDSVGNTVYDRYKWNVSQWLFEYRLNNSSFTAAQWGAINSGATSANIGQIVTNTSDIADLQINKQDVLTAGANIQINNNVISATDTTYTAGTGISIVNNVISNTQTSAEWGNIQGTLNNQTDLQTALDAKQNTISDLSTIRSGATLGATALQPNDNVSELVNDAGYITAASLPTVNDGTLTIQVNGTSIGTFTANQSTNTTADIVVPDSATWGNITGTLSDQTDLQDALDSKLDLSGGTMTGDLSLTDCGIFLSDTLGSESTEITSAQIYNSTQYGEFTLANGTLDFMQPDMSEFYINNSGMFHFETSADGGTTYYTIELDPSNGYLQIPTPTQNYSLVANDAAITAGWLKTNAMPLKQDTLVSGTNIKTLNGNSILGSGDLTLDGLPSQTGQSGKFLTTNGTTASWVTVTIPTPTYDSVNERITW